MSASFPTLERVVGIEPTYSAWKADVLPMNYTRHSPSQTLHQMPLEQQATLPLTLSFTGNANTPIATVSSLKPHTTQAFLFMVEGGGFEPPKLARQIYSLIPLATREPLRKAAYCPDGLPHCQPQTLTKLSTYVAFGPYFFRKVSF